MSKSKEKNEKNTKIKLIQKINEKFGF